MRPGHRASGSWMFHVEWRCKPFRFPFSEMMDVVLSFKERYGIMVIHRDDLCVVHYMSHCFILRAMRKCGIEGYEGV